MATTPRRQYAQRAHDYCRRVVSGEQIASKWIKLACERHLDDLKRTDSRWHFDADIANRVCAFIESHNLQSGDPFVLQDFQVWLVTSLTAWIDDVGTRKYIEALIMTAKGNGIPSDVIGLALTEMQRGLTASVYFGLFEEDGVTLIANPVLAYVGKMGPYRSGRSSGQGHHSG